MLAATLEYSTPRGSDRATVITAGAGGPARPLAEPDRLNGVPSTVPAVRPSPDTKLRRTFSRLARREQRLRFRRPGPRPRPHPAPVERRVAELGVTAVVHVGRRPDPEERQQQGLAGPDGGS